MEPTTWRGASSRASAERGGAALVEKPLGVSTSWNVIVAGGGILGLATAMRLLERSPGLRVLVLEREADVATQQTAHNSGVVHAGVYYAPGSLKARLCVRGREMLLDFCARHGIASQTTGKLIVALRGDEMPRLLELARRAEANGVNGARLVDPAEMREIEPHVAGVKALFCPTTAIVDYRAVALACERIVTEAGGVIRTGCEVRGVDSRPSGLVVRTAQGDEETGGLIACAGLYSDRLARTSGAPSDLAIVPFRGDYYTLAASRRHLCRGLIYPVPDPRFPFLGVHFTRCIDGRVIAGPNAVLAFARQGYGRFDVSLRDLGESLAWPGLRRLATKHLGTGLREMWRDYVKAAYVKALQAYLPAVTSADLAPGPSGVRAQALDRDGALVDDFSFHVAPRMVHVRNAPSPAATSSLAIADAIVAQAAAVMDLGPAPPGN